MAKNNSRLVWTIGLFAALIAAAGLYKTYAPRPLFPSPEAVPSAIQTNPAPPWAPAADRARQSLRTAIAQTNIPGLSVAVAAGGAIVWAEGFGWADIETHVPVTPDTRFRIGTASTVLTAAAAGLLLDQGRLSLDANIQTYVPQFPAKQWPITPRHLMADVSGLDTDNDGLGPLSQQRCDQPVQALPAFANQPLLFEPGTRFGHSTYGWTLLSAAIESAAAQPFYDFMAQRIFQPLGMKHTGAQSAKEENPEAIGEPGEDAPPITFVRDVILKPLGIAGPAPRSAADLATIYSPGYRPYPVVGSGLHHTPPRDLSCYAGAMAFFSTPADLVRFANGALLKPETARLLQSPHKLNSGKETGQGLGWELAAGSAGITGELKGSPVAALLVRNQPAITVAILTNGTHAGPAALAHGVAEAFAQRR